MQKEVYEFISKQSGESILEWKVCKWCGSDFAIFEGDKEMLDKLSPIFEGKKYKLQPPILCPECRNRRQLLFRNERKFYKRKCDATGKMIVSRYAPDYECLVYESDYRWSDKRDPKDYSINYQPGNFLKQYKEFRNKVPKVGLIMLNNENSEYANHSMNNKNCYFTSIAVGNEHCYYGRYLVDNFKIADCYDVMKSAYIYDSVRIHNCKSCVYSADIENSENIYFSKSIKNSKNIIFSFNILNNQNLIFNKPASDEQIQNFKDKLKSYSFYQKCIQKFEKLKKQFLIEKNLNNINAINVIGDNTQNGENLFICFSIQDEKGSKDCRYVSESIIINDSMDVYSSGLEGCELLYNSQGSAQSTKGIALSLCIQNSYSYYSEECFYCNHLFGCCGLKNQSYCILNKQYSKEEREKLVVQIIKELQEQGRRGEYISSEVTAFPYNDTIADDDYPIKKVESNGSTIIDPNGIGTVKVLEPDKFISDAILDLGGEGKIKIKWKTREQEVNIPQGVKTVQAKDLPDNIEDVDNSILNKAIICEVSGRPFRIVKPELEFYHKIGLPLPRKYPELRYQNRLQRMPSRELHLRECDKCNQETLSVFPSDTECRVYCEACYDKEIYG